MAAETLANLGQLRVCWGARGWFGKEGFADWRAAGAEVTQYSRAGRDKQV
jgi:hypothetical protein